MLSLSSPSPKGVLSFLRESERAVGELVVRRSRDSSVKGELKRKLKIKGDQKEKLRRKLGSESWGIGA